MQMFRRVPVRFLLRHVTLVQAAMLLVAWVSITGQGSALDVVRFSHRSLYINSSVPGATTDYKVSLTYTTATSVGSLDMLFCMDPIPYDPCNAPAGLDVTHVTSADQTGEQYDNVQYLASNHILLTRNAPVVVGNTASTYTFHGVVNPTDTSHSFSIRLSDYASTDGTGTVIDLGSVVSEVLDGIDLYTQVPPIMVFCINHTVAPDCSTDDGDAYTDLGALDPTKPLTTTSQMAVATNAFGGFTVSVYGTTLSAGSRVINALTTPTVSAPGNNQFGLNLRANTSPAIGADPDGTANNAVISPNYDIPNEFTYNDGDVLASSNTVSLGKRFTISYIVNSSPTIKAGVYTTTLTYFAIGNF